MAYIENDEIMKDPSHEKKLLSAIRRIEKASKEIAEMDYIIYISAHGSINVLNTDDVPCKNQLDFHFEQVVASGNMERTDCGDW